MNKVWLISVLGILLIVLHTSCATTESMEDPRSAADTSNQYLQLIVTRPITSDPTPIFEVEYEALVVEISEDLGIPANLLLEANQKVADEYISQLVESGLIDEVTANKEHSSIEEDFVRSFTISLAYPEELVNELGDKFTEEDLILAWQHSSDNWIQSSMFESQQNKQVLDQSIYDLLADQALIDLGVPAEDIVLARLQQISFESFVDSYESVSKEDVNLRFQNLLNSALEESGLSSNFPNTYLCGLEDISKTEQRINEYLDIDQSSDLSILQASNSLGCIQNGFSNLCQECNTIEDVSPINNIVIQPDNDVRQGSAGCYSEDKVFVATAWSDFLGKINNFESNSAEEKEAWIAKECNLGGVFGPTYLEIAIGDYSFDKITVRYQSIAPVVQACQFSERFKLINVDESWPIISPPKESVVVFCGYFTDIEFDPSISREVITKITSDVYLYEE